MIRKLLAIMAAAALGVAAPFLVAFAQGLTADQVIADACSNNGALLRYVADGLATVGGASLLANLRKVLPASVVPVLDFFAANWWHYLIAQASAAQDAAKKTAPMLLAVVALGALSLSACSLTNPDGSPMTTAQAADFTLQVACGAYSSDKAPLEVAIKDGLIDQKGADALHQAEALADAVCTGPVPTDLKSAVITVNNAAVQIVLAVAEANKKQAPAAPAAPAKP